MPDGVSDRLRRIILNNPDARTDELARMAGVTNETIWGARTVLRRQGVELPETIKSPVGKAIRASRGKPAKGKPVKDKPEDDMRGGFVFRRSYWDAVRFLPGNLQLSVFKGMCRYAFEGKDKFTEQVDGPAGAALFCLLNGITGTMKEDFG